MIQMRKPGANGVGSGRASQTYANGFDTKTCEQSPPLRDRMLPEHEDDINHVSDAGERRQGIREYGAMCKGGEYLAGVTEAGSRTSCDDYDAEIPRWHTARYHQAGISSFTCANAIRPVPV